MVQRSICLARLGKNCHASGVSEAMRILTAIEHGDAKPDDELLPLSLAQIPA